MGVDYSKTLVLMLPLLIVYFFPLFLFFFCLFCCYFLMRNKLVVGVFRHLCIFINSLNQVVKLESRTWRGSS